MLQKSTRPTCQVGRTREEDKGGGEGRKIFLFPTPTLIITMMTMVVCDLVGRGLGWDGTVESMGKEAMDDFHEMMQTLNEVKTLYRSLGSIHEDDEEEEEEEEEDGEEEKRRRRSEIKDYYNSKRRHQGHGGEGGGGSIETMLAKVGTNDGGSSSHHDGGEDTTRHNV